ncbi:anthrax toxin-like adenylyl cyclase domain-containing protein [Spartinivicinus ruber]|uniref:anthrax toxin-like adenylyl cyclase domain-containing protein n=1 Tax=Spartinivicinus ruber TaxID=2683272 RepID=UPI0013D36445|nr:anthrax toxin-like adenylyl cyclase domain-containing protein [Spartinivicinus ruber]
MDIPSVNQPNSTNPSDPADDIQPITNTRQSKKKGKVLKNKSQNGLSSVLTQVVVPGAVQSLAGKQDGQGNQGQQQGGKLNLPSVDNFLYGDEIQTVANRHKTVLVVRAPNQHSIGLLQEGYASKNFHIKAKSSTGGPTAGFVVTDPLLSKVRGQGTAAIAKQQKTINEALKKGAKAIQIELSDHRIEYLISNKLIETVSSTATSKIIRGHYNDNNQEYFRLTKTTSGAWQLAYLKGYQSLANLGKPIPVMGLTNPPVPGATNPGGAKSVVTADYDLFGIWPTKNRNANPRPLNPAPRAIRGEVAKPYINHVRNQGAGGSEDPNIGNLHPYGQQLMTELNSRINAAGYQGGRLIHHNDESGNPFSPGQDFPLILFVPGEKKPFVINDNAQLTETYNTLESINYSVERNAAFSLPNFQLTNLDKTVQAPEQQKYNHNLIIEIGNDQAVSASAKRLAEKHQGKYTRLKWNPSTKTISVVEGKPINEMPVLGKNSRIFLVGHGQVNGVGDSIQTAVNSQVLSEALVGETGIIRSKLGNQYQGGDIGRISLVSCHSAGKQPMDINSYGASLVKALHDKGVNTTVSARPGYTYVDKDGRKYIQPRDNPLNANNQPINDPSIPRYRTKVVYSIYGGKVNAHVVRLNEPYNGHIRPVQPLPGNTGPNKAVLAEVMTKAFQSQPVGNNGIATTNPIDITQIIPKESQSLAEGQLFTFERVNDKEKRVGKPGYFKFDLSTQNSGLQLKWVPQPSQASVTNGQVFGAYYLPYTGAGPQGQHVPYVDIPKQNPDHNFVFTGGLNGCSVIVCKHPTDPTKLRVYHDSDPEGKNLKKGEKKPYANEDVLVRLDESIYDADYAVMHVGDDLSVGHQPRTYNGVAFLHYDQATGEWGLHHRLTRNVVPSSAADAIEYTLSFNNHPLLSQAIPEAPGEFRSFSKDEKTFDGWFSKDGRFFYKETGTTKPWKLGTEQDQQLFQQTNPDVEVPPLTYNTTNQLANPSLAGSRLPQFDKPFSYHNVPLSDISLSQLVADHPVLSNFFAKDPLAKLRIENAIGQQTHKGESYLSFQVKLKQEAQNQIAKIIGNNSFWDLTGNQLNKVESILNNKFNYDLVDISVAKATVENGILGSWAVYQDKVLDSGVSQTTTQYQGQADNVEGYDLSELVKPAQELRTAQHHDNQLIRDVALAKINQDGIDGQLTSWQVDDNGKISFDVLAEGDKLTTYQAQIDPNQLQETKVLAGFKQELQTGSSKLAKGVSQTSRALGIYMTLQGMQGIAQAAERGDIGGVVGNTALTAYGFADLTTDSAGRNLPRKLVSGTGKYLSKGATKLAEELSEIAARRVSTDLSAKILKGGLSGAAAIRSLGKILGKATPLIGIGLGIHGMVEDLKDPDKVRGAINFTLDLLATITGVLAAVPSPLSPIFEGLSIVFSIARIGFGTLYNSIKSKMDAVPEDAPWTEKAEAFFAGLGEGIEQLFYQFHPIGNIINAIRQSEALEKQSREDAQLLSMLSNYRNYYSIHRPETGGPATIDFSNGPAASYGGGITFDLANPGEDSTLSIDNVPDMTGQQQTRTYTPSTNRVQNMVLGIGQSLKTEMEKRTVKMLWVIPINSKHVIKRNPDGSIPVDSNSMHGEYKGNKLNNVFYTVQKQSSNEQGKPVGPDISQYQYTIDGEAGDDLFYLGPQQIRVKGGDGADTYVTGEHAAKVLTIDNSDQQGKAEIDTLDLDASLMNIRAYRSRTRTENGFTKLISAAVTKKLSKPLQEARAAGKSMKELIALTQQLVEEPWTEQRAKAATKIALEGELASWNNDLVVIYTDSKGQEHQVNVTDWFKGKSNQHLQIKSNDGFILSIDNKVKDRWGDHTQGRKTLSEQHDGSNDCFKTVDDNSEVNLTVVGYDRSLSASVATFDGTEPLYTQVTQITGGKVFDSLTGNAQANIINGYGTNEVGVDRLKGGENSDLYIVQSYYDRPNDVEIDNHAQDKAQDMVMLDARFDDVVVAFKGNDLVMQAKGDKAKIQQQSDDLWKRASQFGDAASYIKEQLQANPNLTQHQFKALLTAKTASLNGKSVSSDFYNAIDLLLSKELGGQLRQFEQDFVASHGQSFAESIEKLAKRYEKVSQDYQTQSHEMQALVHKPQAGRISLTVKNYTLSDNYQHMTFVTKDFIKFTVEKDKAGDIKVKKQGVDASSASEGVIFDAKQWVREGMEQLTGSAFGDRLIGNERNNVLRGGGNGGSLYSYDTLKGEDGKDMYVYQPGRDGLVVIDNFAEDLQTDTALFNANYDNILVNAIDYSDWQASIHLDDSIVLRTADNQAGLVVQQFRKDDLHRHIHFKSADGKLFTINPQTLEKSLVTHEYTSKR